MRSRAIILTVLLGIVCALNSCLSDTTACSTVFATIEFRVVDSLGLPVDSVAITVSNARTDEIYDVGQPQYEAGLYYALTDASRTKVRSYGDPILVHGVRGNLEFDASFIIGLDDEGCHVEKHAGPTVVTIEER